MTDLRRLMQLIEKVEMQSGPATDPVVAHIAPGARRAFGYKGHGAPIRANDPRVVTPIKPPSGDAHERLQIARTTRSAEEYAKMINPIPLERGDQDWVVQKHQQEYDRLIDEWNLWKRSGLLKTA